MSKKSKKTFENVEKLQKTIEKYRKTVKDVENSWKTFQSYLKLSTNHPKPSKIVKIAQNL